MAIYKIEASEKVFKHSPRGTVILDIIAQKEEDAMCRAKGLVKRDFYRLLSVYDSFLKDLE